MPSVSVYVFERKNRSSYYLGYRCPATGRKKTRSAKTSNRREAERAAALWEQQINTIGSANGSTPWADFVELYDERHLSHLRESARDAALSALRIFHRHARPRTVGAVTPMMISDWLSTYRSNGNAEATVRSRLSGVRAALNWAVEVEIIPKAPNIPRQRKQHRRQKSKGRALEPREFVAMLRACRDIVGRKRAKQWRRNLRCLWLSGLRLGEAVNLSWDDPLCIRPDFSGKRPMLIIPGDENKDGEDHVTPITPDWSTWLSRVPDDQRTGKVLTWPKAKQRKASTERQLVDFASKTISDIGEAAGIVVNPRTGKTASAHETRRSFGTRWSRVVMPQVLQLLMRHDDISTTMEYYAGDDVDHAAEAVWNADLGATLGAT
ncbi:MAG: tyrosine-type recombinase/integrase [Planctomycetota bacterium]